MGFYIGQKWEDTPWGEVEIVWLEEVDERRVSVQYSVKGETVKTPIIKNLDCERCMRFPIDVKHDNCRHKGQPGHSPSHCTASTCY